MALNLVIKEGGIESCTGFAVGTLIDSFISTEENKEVSRDVIEVVLGVLANAYAINSYLEFSKSRGVYDVLGGIPLGMMLVATQPNLLRKIHSLSGYVSKKIKKVTVPALGSSSTNPETPAVSANPTRLINASAPMWSKSRSLVI